MSQGFHHINHKHQSKHTTAGKLFDKSMYIIPLTSPIMTIPQLLEVLQYHQKATISIATWTTYTLLSGFWLLYGVLHKEAQIIVVNILLLMVDGAIVVSFLFLH